MRKNFCFFVILFITLPIIANATYDPNPRPSTAELGLFNILSYNITINLERPYNVLDSASVFIVLTHDRASGKPVVLDLEGMICDKVIHTHPYLDFIEYCHFEQRAGSLIIDLGIPSPDGDTFYLEVKYHGHPDGGFYVRSNMFGDTIIYTVSWPSNARCWFPCIDHPSDKAKSSLNILAPKELTVMANGIRTRADTIGREVRHRFEMKFPICTYNICLAAGDFDFWADTSAGGIPIWDFAYPASSANARFDWARTPEIMDTFANYYGDYPFLRYGNAMIPMGLGGMEHQGMTFLSERLVDGRRRYESTVAHELSHSWMGNSVGIADWRDFWLNEGFAVFSEMFYVEKFFGADSARLYRNNVYRLFITSLENFPMYDPAVYLSRTCYQKASGVIHMLRFVMGDSLFFAAVLDWTTRYKYGTVTTDSLKVTFERHYGHDLAWFFDQWVYDVDFLRFYYSYLCRSYGDSFKVMLNIDQIRTTGPEKFITPIELKLIHSGGIIWDTVWLDSTNQTFRWVLPDSITIIQVDPNFHLIKHAIYRSEIQEPKLTTHELTLELHNNGHLVEINFITHFDGTLNIFDLDGRRILSRVISSDENCYLWDSSKCSSGIYFVQLLTPEGTILKQISIIK